MENVIEEANVAVAILTSAYFCITLIVFAAILERRKYEKVAGSITVCSIALFGFGMGMSVWAIIGMLVAYLPLGIGWSILRWRRQTKKIILELKRKSVDEKVIVTESEMKKIQDSTNIFKHFDKIMTWTFVWPASLVCSLSVDLYDMAEQLVREHLITLYTDIAKNTLIKIEDITEVVADPVKMPDKSTFFYTSYGRNRPNATLKFWPKTEESRGIIHSYSLNVEKSACIQESELKSSGIKEHFIDDVDCVIVTNNKLEIVNVYVKHRKQASFAG